MSDVQAEPSSTEPVPAPAEPAPIVAEAVASAPAEAAPVAAPAAETFEQRVVARLDALEGYLMKLPHSIAHALSTSSFGSDSVEEIGKRALAHLFGKN